MVCPVCYYCIQTVYCIHSFVFVCGVISVMLILILLYAFRPSEHPPVRGKMSKRLGGIIGCKYKTSS